MMPMRLAFLLFTLVALSGCIGDDPPYSYLTSEKDIPVKILAAFRHSYPDATIDRIVRCEFKRKIVTFEFTFTNNGEPDQVAGVTPKGEVILYKPPGRSSARPVPPN